MDMVRLELGMSDMGHLRDSRIGLLFFGRSGMGRKDGSLGDSTV